jgi:hypothetical protein
MQLIKLNQKSDNSFIRLPANLLLDPELQPMEKIIIGVLQLFRWQNKSDVTTSDISTAIGRERDHIRRVLNKMKSDPIVKLYVKINFEKIGLNREQLILVEFNDAVINQLSISNSNSNEKIIQDQINPLDLESISRYLKFSKYFASAKPLELIQSIGVSVDELFKGLIYVDSRKEKSVKKPIAYLRSCFVNGEFRYSNFKLQQVPITQQVTTNKNYLYKVRRADAIKLKEYLGGEYLIYPININNELIYINRITCGNKERNIRKLLQEYSVPFTVHKIAEANNEN